MAAAVTKKLELSAPSIALMGGTLLHQPRLCALTAERIHARVKDARCFLCDKSAAVGAGSLRWQGQVKGGLSSAVKSCQRRDEIALTRSEILLRNVKYAKGV